MEVKGGGEIRATIFGRSLSSFACSYSVSMLSAERRKSVGCKMSKRDESDMARTANRCVLSRVSGVEDQTAQVRKNAPLLHCGIVEHTIKLGTRHRDRMKPMTPPAPPNTEKNDTRSSVNTAKA